MGQNCKIKAIGVNTDDEFYSQNLLTDCLTTDEELFLNLRMSHDIMRKLLPRQFPLGFYQGDGIVLVAGGKFTALAVLSIKTLRHTGTTLPVEVFFPNGEEEPKVCKYLETLNAKCISLSNIIDEAIISDFQLLGYQFKSLLIMASSFENVLLIDADNNIMVNVDNIFKQAPFNETGLVTWPDYWKRSTSPLFYELARVEVGDKVRNSVDTVSPVVLKPGLNLEQDVSFHDRNGTIPDGSTESGQLMINKNKHTETVLLSFYYNFNGPKIFYPLLGQGTPGEGDKDTFLAAATVLGKPFYQVKKSPGTEGYHSKDSFHGIAMVQFDPMKDYENVKNIPVKTEKTGFNKINHYMKLPGFFLHLHLPKLDPYTLYEEGTVVEGPKHIRIYTSLKRYGFNFDFERLQFQSMHEIFCGEHPVPFAYVKTQTVDKASLCEYINDHKVFLEKTQFN